MARRPRRNHTAAFKAKVALAAIRAIRILASGGENELRRPRDALAVLCRHG